MTDLIHQTKKGKVYYEKRAALYHLYDFDMRHSDVRNYGYLPYGRRCPEQKTYGWKQPYTHYDRHDKRTMKVIAICTYQTAAVYNSHRLTALKSTSAAISNAVDTY